MGDGHPGAPHRRECAATVSYHSMLSSGSPSFMFSHSRGFSLALTLRNCINTINLDLVAKRSLFPIARKHKLPDSIHGIHHPSSHSLTLLPYIENTAVSENAPGSLSITSCHLWCYTIILFLPLLLYQVPRCLCQRSPLRMRPPPERSTKYSPQPNQMWTLFICSNALPVIYLSCTRDLALQC